MSTDNQIERIRRQQAAERQGTWWTDADGTLVQDHRTAPQPQSGGRR